MSIVLVSVVIPTRNEEHNIASCIDAFRGAVAEGWCEVLVVDNFSEDGTVQVARERCARAFQQGPERSAQRNRGWAEAQGEYVLFVDADMRLPSETLEEIRTALFRPSPPDALYIREKRTGDSWWTRVRNFERSFYDATCIDGLRVIRRPLLQAVEGFDERLFACEDWDLDRRILAVTQHVALTKGHLLHDEQRLTFWRHLRKKRYYAKCFDAYISKWGRDAVTRRQFGFFYRFIGVFLENGKWRRALAHPVYLFAIWAERICVGVIYVASRMLMKQRASD
jgi:glycosyltransferase involved in cell wall biosynthesis